jgi:hypothetical protein
VRKIYEMSERRTASKMGQFVDFEGDWDFMSWKKIASDRVIITPRYSCDTTVDR